MMAKPIKDKRSSSDSAGRSSKGYFAKGNQIGLGNKGKSSEKARELKKALLNAVTEEDIKVIVTKMISQAREGDTPSTKELFDRIWGKAKQEVDFGENTVNSLVDILARMCGNGTGPG